MLKTEVADVVEHARVVVTQKVEGLMHMSECGNTDMRNESDLDACRFPYFTLFSY